MMVPTKEFDQLFQYYKGEITDNALLNKAGRLAAESHMIVHDKSIPDLIAIKKIKPLARQRGRLTKCIRQIGPLSSNSVDVGEEIDEEEEGDLVKGPLETMFKELIKNASRGTKTPKIKEEATPSTSGVKKKSPAAKTPIPPDLAPGTLLRKADILLGKDKRKGKCKRKNETERLKPTSGWEDWAKGKKLRRNLQHDYDTYAQASSTRAWCRHSKMAG